MTETAMAKAVDEQIKRLLPLIEQDLRTVLTPPDHMPADFYLMMQYHMGWVEKDGKPVDSSKGKRLRPLMSLLTADALGGSVDAARPSGASVELIHNFSLLHDDIQDRGTARRGRPTVWTIWGEANAINAGDAMFTLAHLAIPKLGKGVIGGEIQAEMLTLLDETCLELTRGQHMDMAFETREDVSVDEYLEMITGKTSALTAGSVGMGAIAAGADAATREHLCEFGHNLGLAFQVQDDILDIWGDTEKTGKKAAIDIWQRKKSLPVLYGLAQSADLKSRYLDETPFEQNDIDWIVSALADVGAYDYARERVHAYTDATLEHLNAVTVSGAAGDALHGLVSMLLNRSS